MRFGVQGRLFANAAEGHCRRTVDVQPESRKAVFDLGISEPEEVNEGRNINRNHQGDPRDSNT